MLKRASRSRLRSGTPARAESSSRGGETRFSSCHGQGQRGHRPPGCCGRDASCGREPRARHNRTPSGCTACLCGRRMHSNFRPPCPYRRVRNQVAVANSRWAVGGGGRASHRHHPNAQKTRTDGRLEPASRGSPVTETDPSSCVELRRPRPSSRAAHLGRMRKPDG